MVKNFMYVHAPDNIKKIIRECLGLRYVEFLRHTEAICNFEEQRLEGLSKG